MSEARGNAGSPVTINAVRVDGVAGDHDGFTYTVLIDAKPARAPAAARRPPAAAPVPPLRKPQPLKPADADRRDAPRQRTRLRSGKIVDGRERFLTECLVHDLSNSGMRLRLPPGLDLPPAFQVYDDLSGRLMRAELSWRRGAEVGVRFVTGDDSLRSRITAADMRRKFYKLPR